MYPIGLIIMFRQPEIYKELMRIYSIPFAEVPEDELTPEQRYLDRLMRQRPRPGKGG